MDRLGLGLMGVGAAMYVLFAALDLTRWVAANGAAGTALYLGWHLSALACLCIGAYRLRRQSTRRE